MKVVLRDTLTTYWRGRVQYDRGQYLEIYNSGVYENNVKFQCILCCIRILCICIL